MLNKIKELANSSQLIETMLILMLVSFPFGSNILSFSIGFMTIYPFLVFSVLMSFLGFFHLKLIKQKIEKYFLLFLLFWLVYALCLVPFSLGVEEVKMDVRNLLMMNFVSFSLLWTRNFFGTIKWKNILYFSISTVYFMLLFFSLFEFMTGIHFWGEFTHEFKDNLESIYQYSPVFLFDNPNNLLSYILLCSSMLLVLMDRKKRSNFYFPLFLVFPNFFISIITDSRIGVILSFLQMLFVLSIYFPNLVNWFRKNANRNRKRLLFVVSISLVLVFFTTEKYIHPKWTGGIKQKTEFNRFGKTGLMRGVLTLDEVKQCTSEEKQKKKESKRIRVALFLNGFEMGRQSNFIGVGPGQYRYLQEQNRIKYYTSTINSPHFWLIEIFSQYGALVLLLYLFFLFWIKIKAITYFKTDSYFSKVLLLALLTFALVSLMPSGFLILEINWIFVALLVGVVSDLKRKTNKLK